MPSGYLLDDISFSAPPNAPSITSFTPPSGPAGTSVTINGTNLSETESVKFNNTTASSFTVVSDTQITAVVPAGATTGKITVTTPAGTVSSASNFTVTAADAWNSISLGISTGSTSISANRVTLTNLNGDIWNISDGGRYYYRAASGDQTFITKLTNWNANGNDSAKVGIMFRASTDPAAQQFSIHRTGQDRDIKLKYRTSYGAATTNINGPTITNLPLWLRVERRGNTFTASQSTNGLNWSTVGSSITIDGFPSNYLFGLIVASPSETITASATFDLPETRPPAIQGFSPTSGTPGTTVTINGTDLLGTISVTVGGATANITERTPTQLRVVVPDTATTGRIAVRTPYGTATSTNNFSVIVPAPTISGFTPTSGPQGTQVTINGSNFTGASAVAFNGAAARSFSVASADRITAVLPDNATSGRITVTTAGGTATSSGSFTAEPSISGFSPATASPGTTVTINGANLSGATTVTFGGAAASSFSVVSATRITAVVPANAVTGRIAVTTSGGTATSASNLTVIPPPPVISGFSPTSGPPGTTVTINGSHLGTTSSVAFGGAAAAAVTVISADRVTAVVPASANSGPITVSTQGGTTSSSGSFTVTTPPPTISSISPTSGTYGTAVRIVGTNLNGVNAVRFNGKASISFTIISPSEIIATVPTDAGAGQVTVASSSGSASSSSNFVYSSATIYRIFAPAQARTPGQGWRPGLQIQNAGTVNADARLWAFGASGQPHDCGRKSMAAGASANFQADSDCGAAPWAMGSGVFEASQPAVAIVNVTNRGSAGAGGQYRGIDSSKTARELAFPLIKHNHVGRTTTFQVQNASPFTNRIEATMIINSLPYTRVFNNVPPYATIVSGPYDFGVPAGTGQYGSLTVTGTYLLAGVSTEYPHTGALKPNLQAANAAVPDDYGRVLFCPLFRNAHTNMRMTTGVQVQNVSEITQSIEFKFSRPGHPQITHYKTAAPGASVTFYAGDPSLGIPVNSVGSVTLTGQDKLSAIVNDEGGGVTYAAYSCFAQQNLAYKVSLPLYKEFYLGNTTGIQVQNAAAAGGSNATFVATYYPVNGGAPVKLMTRDPIAPGNSFTFWGVSKYWESALTRLSGDPNSLEGKYGSLVIESNTPMAIIANESIFGAPASESDSKNYEGFGQASSTPITPPCFAGPSELEPNDRGTQANGPVCSGRVYTGLPQDSYDMFYFDTTRTADLSVVLSNHASGLQLQLFYQSVSLDSLVKFDANPADGFSIDHRGPAGRYYVGIRSEPSSSSATYNLVVNIE